jgi:hypothetical protein
MGRRRKNAPAHLIFKPSTKGKIMKTIIRHQSQLLFRKSYKPKRIIRISPLPRPTMVFRPVHRFGAKPRLTLVP